MSAATKTRTPGPRGNWLVVSMRNGKIWHCSWTHTWSGANASRRNSEKYIDAEARLRGLPRERLGKVFILDIERMLDFAATEGADEINDLHRLWEISK